MKKNLFRTFAAFLGFALLFGTQLSAQQLATLNVTVTDPSGSVISQAKVSLRDLETDGKRTDFSSVTGIAVVPGLPTGRYQLTVESSQFSTYQGSLTLTVGQNASVVPRDSSGINSAASSTRSRTSSGLSIRGLIGVRDPNEKHLTGIKR